MKLQIRPAESGDLAEYTQLLQRTYQEAYTDESIGLTADCFSREVFASDDTQGYLRSNLRQNEKQRTWLAFLGSEMVGAVTVKNHGAECETVGFYVAPERQGQGIGRRLWERVLEFSSGRDITLDTYVHNHRTIEMYRRWGFEEDVKRGRFYRHWPEWPKDLQAECLYMRRKGSS